MATDRMTASMQRQGGFGVSSVKTMEAQNTPVSTTAPNTTFDAAKLSSPSTVSLPSDPLTTTHADGILGRAENIQKDAEAAAAETVKREQEAAGVGEAQKQKDGFYNDIKGLFNKKAEIQAGVADTPENKQLQDANKSLSEIQTEIADQNVKYRAELDAAQGDASIGAAGVAAKVANVKAKYGRIQADNAIIESAASGNVTRLQSALKDSLDLKLAPIETDIKWFTDYALKNADDMSQKEQAQLKAIVDEKVRQKKEITDQEDIANTALKSAAENGVTIPTDVVKEIMDNPSQAFQILAHHGISLANPLDEELKQANIDNVNSQANERNNAASNAGTNGLTVYGKPMNAEQAKANGYAARIAEANPIFDSIGDQFAGLGGLVLQFSPNYFQTEDYQKFVQAKRNFVNAVLRRESGAAISQPEFDNADKQYFPQPGDSEEVLAQKKQNRETTLNNIRIESGQIAPGQTSPTPVDTSATDKPVEDYVKSLKLK